MHEKHSVVMRRTFKPAFCLKFSLKLLCDAKRFPPIFSASVSSERPRNKKSQTSTLFACLKSVLQETQFFCDKSLEHLQGYNHMEGPNHQFLRNWKHLFFASLTDLRRQFLESWKSDELSNNTFVKMSQTQALSWRQIGPLSLLANISTLTPRTPKYQI